MDTTPLLFSSNRSTLKSNFFTLNYPFIFEINRFYLYFPSGFPWKQGVGQENGESGAGMGSFWDGGEVAPGSWYGDIQEPGERFLPA